MNPFAIGPVKLPNPVIPAPMSGITRSAGLARGTPAGAYRR
ncbi:MAG TPA: hypothetical protein VEK75_00055 [Xanthobacteraceae bacterium]|nr:hypothetical protein [Xanthobacteraceae bacterium]